MATSDNAADGARFDAFLSRCWADHADHAEAVAGRLRTDTPEPVTSAQVAALARLVVHLLGEHLGRFDDAHWRLSALAGQKVRFRFHLKSGTFYSFWVSSEESGASHGYVGAGGPGFPGVIDTIGKASLSK